MAEEPYFADHPEHMEQRIERLRQQASRVGVDAVAFEALLIELGIITG